MKRVSECTLASTRPMFAVARCVCPIRSFFGAVGPFDYGTTDREFCECVLTVASYNDLCWGDRIFTAGDEWILKTFFTRRLPNIVLDGDGGFMIQDTQRLHHIDQF